MIRSWLKQRRLALGLTQEDVANELQMARQIISQYETEQRYMTLELLKELTKVLNFNTLLTEGEILMMEKPPMNLNEQLHQAKEWRRQMKDYGLSQGQLTIGQLEDRLKTEDRVRLDTDYPYQYFTQRVQSTTMEMSVWLQRTPDRDEMTQSLKEFEAGPFFHLQVLLDLGNGTVSRERFIFRWQDVEEYQQLSLDYIRKNIENQFILPQYNREMRELLRHLPIELIKIESMLQVSDDMKLND